MKNPRAKLLGIFVGEEIYYTGGVWTPPSNQQTGFHDTVLPMEKPQAVRRSRTAVQFSEADTPLDIRYDDVFKAVFTRDTPVNAYGD